VVNSKVDNGFPVWINTAARGYIIAGGPTYTQRFFLFFIRVTCVVKEGLVVSTNVLRISILKHFTWEKVWIHVDFGRNNRCLWEHKLSIIVPRLNRWSHSAISRLLYRFLRRINHRHLLLLLIKYTLHVFYFVAKLLILFSGIKVLTLHACFILFFLRQIELQLFQL